MFAVSFAGKGDLTGIRFFFLGRGAVSCVFAPELAQKQKKNLEGTKEGVFCFLLWAL